MGKLYNVQMIVSGKVLRFSEDSWQVSGVILDAQSGIRIKAETRRHQGDIFSLLDQRVPSLAEALAGVTPAQSRSANSPAPPATEASFSNTYWKRTCDPCEYAKGNAAYELLYLNLMPMGAFNYKIPRAQNTWEQFSKNQWKIEGGALVVSWNESRGVEHYSLENVENTPLRGILQAPKDTPVRFTLEKLNAAP